MGLVNDLNKSIKLFIKTADFVLMTAFITQKLSNILDMKIKKSSEMSTKIQNYWREQNERARKDG